MSDRTSTTSLNDPSELAQHVDDPAGCRHRLLVNNAGDLTCLDCQKRLWEVPVAPEQATAEETTSPAPGTAPCTIFWCTECATEPGQGVFHSSDWIPLGGTEATIMVSAWHRHGRGPLLELQVEVASLQILTLEEAQTIGAALAAFADRVQLGMSDQPAVDQEHQVRATSPDPEDVEDLAGMLDLLEGFTSNEQRARYLLASNWLRDRGAVAAARITAGVTDRG